MQTKTAKIRAMSSVPVSLRKTLGLTFSILLDNGLVVRVRPDVVKLWGSAVGVFSTIAYDVDEQGCLSNPRPAPQGIVQGSACPCGDEPAHCQKAHCLVDAP